MDPTLTSKKKATGHATQRRQQLHQLRQRVDGQVSNAQEYMDALRQDLARYREENERLTKQCNRLDRTELSLDVSRLELSELSSRSQADAVEKQRLETLVRTLEKENSELASRCEDLESSIVHERESRSLAKLEIRTLQEQVDQLESMVDLLSSQQDLREKV